MNTIDWEKLCRTYSHDKRDFVILRPGIALVLYSHAELPEVMKATAEVLTGYLDFVPPEAIAAKYE